MQVVGTHWKLNQHLAPSEFFAVTLAPSGHWANTPITMSPFLYCTPGEVSTPNNRALVNWRVRFQKTNIKLQTNLASDPRSTVLKCPQAMIEVARWINPLESHRCGSKPPVNRRTCWPNTTELMNICWAEEPALNCAHSHHLHQFNYWQDSSRVTYTTA